MATNRKVDPTKRRSVTVTGAAGFIGGHLMDSLAADSELHVVGIDSLRSGSWDRFSNDGTQITADLRNLNSKEMEELLRGSSVLFHLAAEKHNSARDPIEVIDVNVSATYRLFEAAAKVGVGRVVFASSLYAYGSMGPEPMSEGDPPSPRTLYGVTKVAGEHLLQMAARQADMKWAIARLFFVYGPKQYARGGYKSVIVSNFERIARGEPPVINGDGEQALDYVFVDDVIKALRDLADVDSPNGVMNFGYGQAWSVNDLTDLMLQVADSRLQPVYAPADWTAGSIRVCDPTAARDRIGWKPSVQMQDGLELTWESLTHGR